MPPRLPASIVQLANEREKHYRRWSVPKLDGSRREITAPDPMLKAAQQWIARNVWAGFPVHPSAHGFVSGRSIVTNASVHAGAAVIVKLDLRGFFPSVSRAHVADLLRTTSIEPNDAATLAALAVDPRTDALPQGAPTSPSITNALCLRLDARCAAAAEAAGARYTRYADDLTFSWPDAADPEIPELLAIVTEAARAEGFEVHPRKTKIMRSGSRQAITGLVVNAAPGAAPVRVPRETVRRLRAAIHNREQGRSGRESIEQLRGLASLVYSTDPVRGRGFLDRIAALTEKKEHHRMSQHRYSATFPTPRAARSAASYLRLAFPAHFHGLTEDGSSVAIDANPGSPAVAYLRKEAIELKDEGSAHPQQVAARMIAKKLADLESTGTGSKAARDAAEAAGKALAEGNGAAFFNAAKVFWKAAEKPAKASPAKASPAKPRRPSRR